MFLFSIAASCGEFCSVMPRARVSISVTPCDGHASHGLSSSHSMPHFQSSGINDLILNAMITAHSLAVPCIIALGEHVVQNHDFSKLEVCCWCDDFAGNGQDGAATEVPLGTTSSEEGGK